MTGCDLQDRHSGLLVHRVMLDNYARGPPASDAHAVLPFSPADLEPTSCSNGASFAASIYSPQRCSLQRLYSRECRMQYCSSCSHRGGQLQLMLVRPHPPTPVVQVFFRSPAEVLVSKNLTLSGRMQYARRLWKIPSAADFSWQTPPMPSHAPLFRPSAAARLRIRRQWNPPRAVVCGLRPVCSGTTVTVGRPRGLTLRSRLCGRPVAACDRKPMAPRVGHLQRTAISSDSEQQLQRPQLQRPAATANGSYSDQRPATSEPS